MIQKITAFILLLLSSVTPVVAGDLTYQHKKTLLRAFREFEKIRSAQYDVAVSYRSPFQGQIITTQGHCAFSRLSEDKVFGARIALARAHQDGTVTRHWYDGRYEVMLQADKQGEAYVADMKQPGRTFYIAANLSTQLSLFKPVLPILLFGGNAKYYLQELIQKRAIRIEKLPDVSINNRVCSVFNVHCKDREEIKNELLSFFIDHEMRVPIKYVHKKVYWGSPTYEEATISDITLCYHDDPLCVPDARALIPGDCKVVNTHEQEWPPSTSLLSENTVAPSWTLPTVQGNDTLSLEALRGKVVLLSFWYRSFGPSLQYLRTLQKLQEKFQKQGLVVVGINTHDEYEELATFLQQRGIMYPNLIGNMQTEADYQAYTPNTFYLLDQWGRICDASIEQAKFPHKVVSRHIKQLLVGYRQYQARQRSEYDALAKVYQEGMYAEHRPIFQFTERIFDFGTITAGETVAHTYTFTNTGDRPLIIHEVTGGCCSECVAATWLQEPIAPGKQGQIKVHLNGTDETGAQEQVIAIRANTDPPEARILLKGVVNKPGVDDEQR